MIKFARVKVLGWRNYHSKTASKSSYGEKLHSYYMDDCSSLNFKAVLDNVGDTYQISKDPKDYEIIVVRAVEADTPNDNGDAFPKGELLRFDSKIGEKVYRTFNLKPHHVNHQSQDPRMARGVILDSHFNELNDGETFVEILVASDKTKDPILIKNIINGRLDKFSMGCHCDYTTCSICDHKAYNELQFCDHIAHNKMQKIAGKLAFENCYGVVYDEISSVYDPAMKGCEVIDVIKAEKDDSIERKIQIQTAELLKKSSVDSTDSYIIISGLKDNQIVTISNEPKKEVKYMKGKRAQEDEILEKELKEKELVKDKDEEAAKCADPEIELEPDLEPVLKPELEIEPELEPVLEPVPELDDVKKGEPEVEPVLEPELEPEMEPVPVIAPEPVLEPVPEMIPESEPVLEPELESVPEMDIAEAADELDKVDDGELTEEEFGVQGGLLDLEAERVAGNCWVVSDSKGPLYLIKLNKAFPTKFSEFKDRFASRDYGVDLMKAILKEGFIKTMNRVNAINVVSDIAMPKDTKYPELWLEVVGETMEVPVDPKHIEAEYKKKVAGYYDESIYKSKGKTPQERWDNNNEFTRKNFLREVEPYIEFEGIEDQLGKRWQSLDRDFKEYLMKLDRKAARKVAEPAKVETSEGGKVDFDVRSPTEYKIKEDVQPIISPAEVAKDKKDALDTLPPTDTHHLTSNYESVSVEFNKDAWKVFSGDDHIFSIEAKNGTRKIGEKILLRIAEEGLHDTWNKFGQDLPAGITQDRLTDLDESEKKYKVKDDKPKIIGPSELKKDKQTSIDELPPTDGSVIKLEQLKRQALKDVEEVLEKEKEAYKAKLRRGMKLAAKRANYNVESNTLKAALWDVLTKVAQLGDDVAEVAIESAFEQAGEEYVSDIMERGEELAEYSTPAFAQLEADMKNIKAISVSGQEDEDEDDEKDEKDEEKKEARKIEAQAEQGSLGLKRTTMIDDLKNNKIRGAIKRYNVVKK